MRFAGSGLLVIGLTGGIGSGKSMVARMFSELGAEVIDVDKVARELQEPGQPALQEIRSEFGPDVIGPDGRLKRRVLGRMVFGNPSALRKLNQIMFPKLYSEVQRRLDCYRSQMAESYHADKLGNPASDFIGDLISDSTPSTSASIPTSRLAAVVIDAAILFDAGMDRLADVVVVVRADDDVRVRRLMERNGYSAEEALRRMHSQTGQVELCQRADYVIENSGSLEETRQQTIRIWKEIMKYNGRIV